MAPKKESQASAQRLYSLSFRETKKSTPIFFKNFHTKTQKMARLSQINLFNVTLRGGTLRKPQDTIHHTAKRLNEKRLKRLARVFKTHGPMLT